MRVRSLVSSVGNPEVPEHRHDRQALPDSRYQPLLDRLQVRCGLLSMKLSRCTLICGCQAGRVVVGSYSYVAPGSPILGKAEESSWP